MATIVVLGTGIMATALTTPLTDNGHEVRLVVVVRAKQIAKADVNSAHPGSRGPEEQLGGEDPRLRFWFPLLAELKRDGGACLPRLSGQSLVGLMLAVGFQRQVS